MVSVSFTNLKRSVKVPNNATVADACAAVGRPLDLVCGGNGTCGKCRVMVKVNGVASMVLACQTPVRKGMEITLRPQRRHRILDATDQTAFAIDKNLVERWKGRYGAACDLGTTTVVLYLFDLADGTLLGHWSALNSQAELGADVISRLQAARVPDQAFRLQQEAIKTVNALLCQAAESCAIPAKAIRTLVLAGNSAMQHLFFQFPVEKLVRSPYQCHTTRMVKRRAKALGLAMAPDGMVRFLPLIGSFVGGDTVGAALACDLPNSPDPVLLIDLGTNGELVLGDHSGLSATSAAAGPAMEGAGIRCGMRGSEGAVEKVRLTADGISMDVIGAEQPVGICGSGLVSLAAELLRLGIVDESGRMRLPEELRSTPIAAHMATVDNQPAFFLTADGSVMLTQADLRSLQLAKGAIAAAAKLLLRQRGLPPESLKEVLLAGAFGNYIDIASAQAIGLIPAFADVPVRGVGNAAGAGAQRCLLSEAAMHEARKLAAATEHIELATLPGFTQAFAEGMSFRPLTTVEPEQY